MTEYDIKLNANTLSNLLTESTGLAQLLEPVLNQVLPSPQTVPMLFRVLMAAGQPRMRKVDGSETLDQPLANEILGLASRNRSKHQTARIRHGIISTTFETQAATKPLGVKIW